MARCETGYLCDVCGAEVETIIESDLYLRYILGEVPPELLPRQRERHIRCNPVLAQFIVDPHFPPVMAPPPFAKAELDRNFVQQEEFRVTRGWQRLQQVVRLGLSIADYPLPEVKAAWSLAKES